MERRDFIQQVLAGLAALSIPDALATEYPEPMPGFDASRQYGQAIICYLEDPMFFAPEVMRMARKVLPRGTPFTLVVKNPAGEGDIYDECSSIAWKYSPRLRYGDVGVFRA